MLAYRCRNHRSNAHHRWSVLQESPAQLRIFEFATTTIDERSVSHRLSNCIKMPCARTLSRTVWQQKNFCGYSAEVSPTRAETNFSDESRSPIRMLAYRRDSQVLDRDSRSIRPRALRSQHHERCERPITGRFQMPSFAFSRSLTACGLALPPDCFIT